MKGFVFTLEGALRLHRTRVRWEENELSRLLQRRSQLQTLLENAIKDREETEARTAKLAENGANGAELPVLTAASTAQSIYIAGMRSELAALEKACTAQRARYITAKQECEKFHQLREQEYELWRCEQARSEQRFLDETFLLHRFSRK